MKKNKVLDIITSTTSGLDAVEVIPLVDLDSVLQRTLEHLQKGMMPSTYRWTESKTRYAYSYKNYSRWARSIIVAAKYYHTGEPYQSDPLFGRIAPFSWRNNYLYITLQLEQALEALEKYMGKKIKARVLSNYTSIPEKPLFRYSGLGEAGRNSVLINPHMGSYFCVGEMLTELEVEDFANPPSPAPPDFSICGECFRCIKACPTGAITGPGAVNINRCFQYLSENLVVVPRKWRNRWGPRLYGCSTCLEVCPYNQRLTPWAEKHQVGYVGTGMHLPDVLKLSPQQWDLRFQNNQIARRESLAIVKNAVLALGCSGNRWCLEAIRDFLEHPSPVIRATAAWAVGNINTPSGNKKLEELYKKEEDPEVRKEIEYFL
ncbi:MAG: epoxyqueuosine reductase [Spirochaetota bacterium]